MKLIDTIETFISGDWGNETLTEETPCEVYCVRGADIEPIKNQDYNHIPIRYISKRSYENKLLQAGDIIVEKSGGSPTQSTGRVCLITPDLVEKLHSVDCSNFCTAFRVKKEWDAEYIYLYIQHIYNMGAFFNFEGKTSGIKNLQLEQAYQAIEIKPIPLAEQKKLAKVIRTMDSKMAINRAINQNLEAMAKQLYDYWFVQFDFPNEGGKPYKSSGGEMEWNEKLKREIPKGWSSSLLSEIADIRNGATPSTAVEDNYGGNIIWITPKDLSDQQSKFVFYGQRNITQKGYDSCSTSMLPKGSVLLSSRAPIGLVAVAMAEVCTNQGFKNMVPNDMILTYFLYYYIKQNVQKIEQLGTGTTFKEVSKDDLKSFPILEIKDRTLLEKWNDKMVAFANQQFLLEKEILELTKQRDELLPLLMNGQVSVTQLNSDLSQS